MKPHECHRRRGRSAAARSSAVVITPSRQRSIRCSRSVRMPAATAAPSMSTDDAPLGDEYPHFVGERKHLDETLSVPGTRYRRTRRSHDLVRGGAGRTPRAAIRAGRARPPRRSTSLGMPGRSCGRSAGQRRRSSAAPTRARVADEIDQTANTSGACGRDERRQQEGVACATHRCSRRLVVDRAGPRRRRRDRKRGSREGRLQR